MTWVALHHFLLLFCFGQCARIREQPRFDAKGALGSIASIAYRRYPVMLLIAPGQTGRWQPPTFSASGPLLRRQHPQRLLRRSVVSASSLLLWLVRVLLAGAPLNLLCRYLCTFAASFEEAS